MVGGLVTTGDPNGQKATVYIGTMQSGPRAGTAWSLNTDTVRNGNPSGINGQAASGSPGAANTIGANDGTIGYELDFTNWDRDCTITQTFCIGMYVHNQGLYASGAGIYFDSHPQNPQQNNYAWHHGIWFNNAYTLQDDAFYDATNATDSIRIEGSHINGIDTTSPSVRLKHLVNGRAGQDLCLNNSDGCLIYDGIAGAWAWTTGGRKVAVLTSAGLFNPSKGIRTMGPISGAGGLEVSGPVVLKDDVSITGTLGRQTEEGVKARGSTRESAAPLSARYDTVSNCPVGGVSLPQKWAIGDAVTVFNACGMPFLVYPGNADEHLAIANRLLEPGAAVQMGSNVTSLTFVKMSAELWREQ